MPRVWPAAVALLGLVACGGASTLRCDICNRDADCIHGGETCHLGICVPEGEDPRRCPNFAGTSGSGSGTGAASSGSSAASSSSAAGSSAGSSVASSASSSSGSGSSGGSVTSSSGTSGPSSSSSSSSSSGSSGTTGLAPYPLDFAPARVLPAGPYPDWIATGRLTRGGHQDLVVVNRGAASLTILRGYGDGGFASSILPTVTSPYGLALADLNGDGRLDIAVTTSSFGALGNGLLALHFQDSLGGFQDGGTFITGAGARGVTVGDFGGDGLPELVVANFNDGTLSVFSRAGGAFASVGTIPSPSGPRDPHPAWLDGDGSLDLVVDRDNDTGINVLLGVGDAGLGSAVSYGQNGGVLADDPKSIAVGDLNGDGAPDVVTFNTNAGTLSIFFNDGQGHFVLADTLATEPRPYAGTMADMNGDGLQDVVACDETDNAVEIYLGAGDGGFQVQADGGVRWVFKTSSAGNDGSGPQSLVVADFNEDGKADVATGDNAGLQHDGGITLLLSR